MLHVACCNGSNLYAISASRFSSLLPYFTALPFVFQPSSLSTTMSESNSSTDANTVTAATTLTQLAAGNHDLANALELEAALARARQEQRDSRPSNTVRQYDSRAEEFEVCVMFQSFHLKQMDLILRLLHCTRNGVRKPNVLQMADSSQRANCCCSLTKWY